MENVKNTVHRIRRYYDEGKQYLTRETPFKDKHSFVQNVKKKLSVLEINILIESLLFVNV